MVGVVAIFVATAGLTTSAMAQSFALVGGGLSFVKGLSADGRTAAGYIPSSQGFFWTAEAGRDDFGLSISQNTRAQGISGNGLTVVGGGPSSDGLTAFRWSAAGGYQNLGTTQNFTSSMATDANHDGSIVVGTLDRGVGTSSQAFRWTQSGGMQAIGFTGSRANAISGDGNVVVGDWGTGPTAFTWTRAGDMQFLPSLGGTGASIARATNFAGNIIVGGSGPTLQPTMWVNGAPIQLASSIPDSRMTPFAVNDDGSVVVGVVQNDFGQMFGGIWTPSTGTIRLDNYLTANGVTIPAGINLEFVTSISADGRTFGGYTSNGPLGILGFVATVPTPCPADLDNDGLLSNGGTRDRAVTIDDLLFLLIAFESGNMAADLDNGSSTGTRDNAVTIDDLLYFLTHFEAGC